MIAFCVTLIRPSDYASLMGGFEKVPAFYGQQTSSCFPVDATDLLGHFQHLALSMIISKISLLSLKDAVISNT